MVFTLKISLIIEKNKMSTNSNTEKIYSHLPN